MVSVPQGVDHRGGFAARQPLPGRPLFGGAPGGVPLRPRRPHFGVGLPGGQVHGRGGALCDLGAHPFPPAPGGGIDYLGLVLDASEDAIPGAIHYRHFGDNDDKETGGDQP
jgi:hypothetical protein